MPRLWLPEVPGVSSGQAGEAARCFARAGAPPADPEADALRYLMEAAPLAFFDGLLSPSGLGVPPPGFVAASWVAGVWRGTWFRHVYLAADPDGALAGATAALGPEAARDPLAASRRLLDAMTASGAELLAGAESAIPMLAGAFGTSLGALLEVLAAPPPAAADRSEECEEESVLWARLAGPRLRCGAALHPVADALEDPDTARWAALADHVARERAGALERSRLLWATTLAPSALGEDAYTRVVDALRVALEVDQAVALTACLAVADEDAEAAVRALAAAAGSRAWHRSTQSALVEPARDGVPDPAWPRIVDG